MNLRSVALSTVLFTAGFATVAVVLSVRPWDGTGGSAQSRDEAVQQAALQGAASAPSSSFQDGLLADGKLTDVEYESAFARYADCVTAAGGSFVPPSPQRNKLGLYAFSIAIPPDGSGQPGQLQTNPRVKAVKACGETYFDAVQQRWSAEHQPGVEAVAAAKAGIANCMRARGVTLPANLADGWGRQFMEGEPDPVDAAAFRDCALNAGEELGAPPGTFPIP